MNRSLPDAKTPEAHQQARLGSLGPWIGVWLPGLILALWALLALSASVLELAPNRVDLGAILAPPGGASLLGNDDLGRPVWDRLLVGAQVSLAVGVSVVGISAVLGTLIGALAGFAGGPADLVLTRIMDVFLAFPGILLAIAVAGALGPGIGNLILALVAVGWVGYARLARAQVLSLAQRDHVIAARALGQRSGTILGRHLIPLALAPLTVEATFGVSATVMAEAGLSFLALGVQPPDASWGSLIRDGVAYMLVAPHLVMAPGFAIIAVVLAMNLLGDTLRDRLDVRCPQD